MSEPREGDAVDVTDDLLGSSSDFLRVVVDSALAAVVVMSDRGVITGWGRRAEETFGFSRREALGVPLVDLIVPSQHRAAHDAGLARYRQTGEGPVLGAVVELSALHADGHEFPAELAISPAAKVGGRTTFIAFVRDISERREAERRQDELYSYAAEAMKALRDFASLSVHELRTPLSVANGYLSMLLDGSLGPPAEEWLKTLAIVQAKLQEAGVLVGELLEAARLEGGALQPNLQRVDAAEMAVDAIERARSRARMVGSEVALLGPHATPMVEADTGMCGKILDNLLNNAISHAGRGARIEVGVSDSPVPAITVTDNGGGISDAVRDRIFERFYRADGSSDNSGAGLGLYLSRQLAEIQGATLELEWTEPGRGSRFSLAFAEPYS